LHQSIDWLYGDALSATLAHLHHTSPPVCVCFHSGAYIGPIDIDGMNGAVEYFPTESFQVHPDYFAPTSQYDVMLIKLNGWSKRKPFGYNSDPSTPPPIRLVGGSRTGNSNGNRTDQMNIVVDDDDSNSTVTVVGFGTMSENGTALSDVLRAANVSVFPYDYCARTFDDKPIVDAIHICAGTMEGGRDACQSDRYGY